MECADLRRYRRRACRFLPGWSSPKGESRISGFGRQQRHAEFGTPRKPDIRAIARIAVDSIHRREYLVHTLRTEYVAEPERTIRVVEAERDSLVDVGGLCCPALRDRAPDVDDHRNDALCDQARAVAAHRHRHAVG